MNSRSNSTPKSPNRKRLGRGTVLVAVAASLGTVAALAPPAAASADGARTTASAVRAPAANTPPAIPDRLTTNPATACGGGFVGNTQLTLLARVRDADSVGLTAQFQIFAPGASEPVADASAGATAGSTASYRADLPSGDYRWRVRAEDSEGAASAWTGFCSFSVDRVRPDKPPTVSSQEFPDGSGGRPAETGKARTPGTFTLGAGGVDDVVGYVWYTSFDQTQREVSVSPGGTADVTATPLTGGPHMLYVYSVDRSGNRSDTTTYSFYAQGITAPDAPGDLNGDGAKDIWSLDAQGKLLTYAGRGDGAFAPAADGNLTVPDARAAAYRTDWDGDGYVDLVTLEYDPYEQRQRLWVRSNNGLGAVNSAIGRQEFMVDCPVPDESYGCMGEPGWTGDDHWGDAEQVIAPGDLNGDGRGDLLVQEGGRLWVYHGLWGQMLDAPVRVDATDWDDHTVLAPGDVDGDGLADLWLREKATGDLYSVPGGSGPDGALNPAAWGDPADRVKIGTGFTVAARPVLDTVGDLDGDGIADLHGRSQDGAPTLWPGRVAADGGFGFGEGRAIG